MSPLFSSEKPGILVIDDETNMLDIIKTTLEGEGYRVFTAGEPQVGLDLYEQHWREIKVVLLDYLMPNMTGDLVFECLQRINPDVRVLLLTACDDPKWAARLYPEAVLSRRPHQPRRRGS